MSSDKRFVNDQLLNPARPIPGMVSDIDVTLVDQLSRELNPDDIALEMGPWLGRLSLQIARHAKLHAVDTFKWTADHDRRVPDVLAPGDSFESLYQEILRHRDCDVTTYQSSFANFQWTGGAINFCVIDSPKSAEALRECLLPVAPHLAPGAQVVVINGLHPKHREMTAYIGNLVAGGVFTLVDLNGNGKSKAAVIQAGPNLAAFDDISSSGSAAAVDLLTSKTEGATIPANMALISIAELVKAERWADAYKELSDLPPSRENTFFWESLTSDMPRHVAEQPWFSVFSEIMGVHNDQIGEVAPAEGFHRSISLALRAFWQNNADKPWRGVAFAPDIISRAFDFGYMKWASRIAEHVRGKDVLDVGCGPGLHGIGFLTAGAKSFFGVDPIIKPDRDRVKNLAAGGKMPFGWTPNELMDRIPSWRVSPMPIGETKKERVYDIAVLHNATEHFLEIESVFDDIAARLRPGGVLIYNHHNFYAWNGHHLPPKKVSAIDPSDPKQLEMLDWGHVEYDPEPDHYIARGLNRIRLDDLIALTKKYFEIEVLEDILSEPDTGLGRLTDSIRARYPYLSDRDFETKNLFCIARICL